MSEEVMPPASRYERAFAWAMNRFGPKAEWRFRERKINLFSCLRREEGVCTVVEVGMGTAPNLKFYAKDVDRIVGVDPNTAMHQYARKSAEAVGAEDKLQLVTASAEALPLEDDSADAVVLTHVLCSVRDQQQALAEARRVLKPGGKLLFLEHVAAPEGEMLHTVQRLANPVVGLLGHGCSATRHTLAALERAGFSSLDADSFTVSFWSPGIVMAPHIVGQAVK